MPFSRIAATAIKRLMTGVAAAVAIVVLFQFVGVVLARISYPFDLEWMESGVVTHVRRILEGKALYGPPSFEFTAYLYPPFYYYVSALFSAVLGLENFAPRLVSVLATLGTFVLIARWVQRETGDTLAGFVATASFCACYAETEYWYDIARVDSLFLALLLGGWTLLRVATTPRQALLAGVLLALSCLTKQSATPFALAGVGLLLLRAPKLALYAALALGTIALGGVLALNTSSRGYFWYYVVELPSQHEVHWSRWGQVFRQYIWTPTAPMVLAGAALLCGAGFRSHQRWAWAFSAAFVTVAVMMSMTSILKTGGYMNALMPAYAALAIAFGTQFAAVRRAGNFGLGTAGAYSLATFAFLIQMRLLMNDQQPGPTNEAQDTRHPVPTNEDVVASLHMRARIAKLPEPLWVTTSSELSRMNGRPGALAPTMGIADVMKAGGTQAQRVGDDVARAIRERRFACIVTDRAIGFLNVGYLDLIRQYYQPAGSVLEGEPKTALWPRSGAWLRPDQIWFPK